MALHTSVRTLAVTSVLLCLAATASAQYYSNYGYSGGYSSYPYDYYGSGGNSYASGYSGYGGYNNAYNPYR